jgi:deoxyinosine 3'endonuclease (endonuclease V)
VDTVSILNNDTARQLIQSIREQLKLKEKLIEEDQYDFMIVTDQTSVGSDNTAPTTLVGLHRVAGVDLSFYEDDEHHAVAALVVLSFPDMKVLYQDLAHVELHYPYRAGFLAFREAPPILELLQKLRHQSPELWPQVWG